MWGVAQRHPFISTLCLKWFIHLKKKNQPRELLTKRYGEQATIFFQQNTPKHLNIPSMFWYLSYSSFTQPMKLGGNTSGYTFIFSLRLRHRFWKQYHCGLSFKSSICKSNYRAPSVLRIPVKASCNWAKPKSHVIWFDYKTTTDEVSIIIGLGLT